MNISDRINDLQATLDALKHDFNQHSPEPTRRLPKVGELIWVKNKENEWLPRVCIEAYINKQEICCQFTTPRNDNGGYTWPEWKFYNEIIFTTKSLEHLPKDSAKQIKDTRDKVKFIDEYTRTAVNEGTVMAKENTDV